MTKKLDQKTEESVIRLARLGCCGGGGGSDYLMGVQFAYALACGEMDFQPQQYLIRVLMNSGAAGTPVPGGLASPISAPFWCHDITYQIRQRNGGGFAGSVFEKQAENEYAQNSGIDAQIRVVGGYSLPWLFNGGSKSPIESLARWTGSTALSYYSMKKDFLLYFPQDLKVDLTPSVALPDANTEVIIAFNGLQLGFQKIGLPPGECRAALAGDFAINASLIQSSFMPGGSVR